MRIEKGDYIAKEDITSEAIHALVVKCFEAAGATKRGKFGNMPIPDGRIGLAVQSDGDIAWAICESGRRRLTLQQLLTAENSIQWPDWAVDIRVISGAPRFTDGKTRAQGLLGGWITDFSAGFDWHPTLATRTNPEQGWYDYDKQIPVGSELPPAASECQYTIGTGFGGFKNCHFIGKNSLGSLVIELPDGVFKCYHRHQVNFRPLDWNRRQDQERQEFVDKYMNVAKQAKPECDVEFAQALFDAGYRFTKQKK